MAQHAQLRDEIREAAESLELSHSSSDKQIKKRLLPLLPPQLVSQLQTAAEARGLDPERTLVDHVRLMLAPTL